MPTAADIKLLEAIAALHKEIGSISREVGEGNATVAAIQRVLDAETKRIEVAMRDLTAKIEHLEETKLSVDLPRFEAQQKDQRAEVTQIVRPRTRQWDRAKPFAIAAPGALALLKDLIEALVKALNGGG